MKKYVGSLTTLVLLGVFAVSCLPDTKPTPDQLTQEVIAIDDYLIKNVKDYTLYDASGIRIVIHRFGETPPPHTGQTIKATVKGKLFSDGTVFEEKTLNDLVENISVKGLKFGLTSLLGGSRATLYIPSAHAYGQNGTSVVPANATVVYEVDMTEITRSNAEQLQFTLDTAAIRKYIVDNKIENVHLHSSGIFYAITKVGTTDPPKPYDVVDLRYKGNFIPGGQEFDAGYLRSQNAFSLIDGFKTGLPLVRVGGSVVLYIPSGLAYGTKGAGSSIPSNANLKFEIDLVSIIK